MKQIAPDPGSVMTFHELANRATEHADRPAVDFSQPSAYDQLAQRFIELSPRFEDTLHTLIIDEGQDFEQAWAESLMRMTRKDARLLWLEDPEQALYERPAIDLPGWVRLSSPVNYRSPQHLVVFINCLGLTDEPVEAGSAVAGFAPHWIVYEDSASPVAATEQAVAQLREQGFDASNIAVLSLRGRESSQIAGQAGPQQLAGIAVRRAVGFDADGNALWTEGELLVDTVFRFKGQAADAVVITEIDFEAFTVRERRRLFVALTRARLQVVLVTSDRAARILEDRLGT
jgi:superfamily I DNA and RNA helicase